MDSQIKRMVRESAGIRVDKVRAEINAARWQEALQIAKELVKDLEALASEK